MMAGFRSTASLLILLPVLSSGLAHAQENEPSFSTPLRLRTLDTQDLRGPQSPQTPQAGEALPEAATATANGVEVDAIDDFDLLDDAPLPSVRQNLPDAASVAEGESEPSRQAEQTAPLQLRTLGAAIGPVRSPLFRPAERIGPTNIAATLRPSLPLGATDTFAPLGIRAGRFLLFPTLEQDVGISDNLDLSPDGASGAFAETRGTLRMESDWSRHAFSLTGTAAYRRNFEGALRDEPRLGVNALLRLDIDRDLTATLRGAASYAREDPILTDPLLPPSERPEVLSYSLGAEIERAVARVRLTASADVVRDERDIGGAGAGADDYTTASAGLRAGYDLAPFLQPFASASVGRRLFDQTPAGLLSRDSWLPALRAGLAFDRGEKLSGEFALGYAWNVPEADELQTLSAPTLDFTVNWSPQRGTDVFLTGTTFFDPDNSNLSTSTVYEAALGVRHSLTRRLSATGRLTAALREREGEGTLDDRTLSAEIGLEHWLNRSLALTALARHERFQSEAPLAEYSANTVRVGLRAQR